MMTRFPGRLQQLGPQTTPDLMSGSTHSKGHTPVPVRITSNLTEIKKKKKRQLSKNSISSFVKTYKQVGPQLSRWCCAAKHPKPWLSTAPRATCSVSTQGLHLPDRIHLTLLAGGLGQPWAPGSKLTSWACLSQAAGTAGLSAYLPSRAPGLGTGLSLLRTGSQLPRKDELQWSHRPHGIHSSRP